MKRPVEPPETSEAQQSPDLPTSPKPFNIFEGLSQEPLPPAQETSAPGAALVQKENDVSKTIPEAASSRVENATASAPQKSLNSTYILIAIVALILGVVIGIVLK
jgi:hypothetical protein